MKQAFLFQKIPSYLLAFIFVFFLSEDNVFNLFVILGQAHFVIAHIYRSKTQGITKTFLIPFFLVLTGLVAAIIYFSLNYFIFLIAGTHFMVHFVLDEVKLFAQQHSIYTLLESLPVVFLFSALEIDDLYYFDWVIGLAVIVSIIILVIYVGLIIYKKRKLNLISYYFHFLSLILFIIIFFGFSPSILKLFGFIIFVHYLNWYIFYFFKLKSHPKELKTYLKIVFLSNAIILALFMLYTYGSFTGILFYLFSPVYFYLGTFMHTTFSSRFIDYKNSLSL